MKSKSKVTLSQVAREAGVSIASASYALNGRGGVSGETVDLVMEAARKLGYKPRKTRPQPVRAEGGQVLFLVGDSDPAALHTHQMVSISRNAGRLFADFGMEMLTATLPESGAPPICLRRRQVRGVLFRSGSGLSEELVQSLGSLPCVEFFADGIRDDRDEVLTDGQAVARMAVDHLAERGCGGLVVLNCDRQNLSYHLTATAAVHDARMRGWSASLVEIPKNQPVSEITAGLVGSGGRTGVFIAGYSQLNLPEGVGPALRQSGITPENGYEVISVSSNLQGLSHACCHLSMSHFGRMCAEQLVWRIAHPHAAPRRILFKPRLVLPDPTSAVSTSTKGVSP